MSVAYVIPCHSTTSPAFKPFFSKKRSQRFGVTKTILEVKQRNDENDQQQKMLWNNK